MSRPNVIYILADDMGYGDMGCNNSHSKIPTPHLDRLAQQGMRFTNAHAPSSVCTPSRYAVLTGRYCWRSRLKNGIVWQWDAALIEPERQTVADVLRGAGYRTACIGKWHLGWDWELTDRSRANDHVDFGSFDREQRPGVESLIDYTKPMRGGPTDHGFESYFGDDVPNFPPYTWFEDDHVLNVPTVPKPVEMFGAPGQMVPDWALDQVMPTITGRVVDYIEQADDEPFFLYFPLTAPHTPIVPTTDFRGLSGAGEYGDYVCALDWCVGQVMDALEREGKDQNTLIIFTSDNGPEHFAYERIREHDHYSMGDLRGLKRDAWEGGHRVPFVAHWPAVIEAGSRCDHLTTLGDLMATCAELAACDVPDGAGEDSVSIVPLLRGAGPVRRCAVHHSMTGRFAVRRGDWVFIDDVTGGDNKEPEWLQRQRGYEPHSHPGELYDLRDDLGQRVNRYGDQPEIVAELKQILEEVKAGADQRVRADEGT
jgi:arylsulfatase A